MKTGLQWILQEAKDLRKKYPKRFENWKQYVAQATAIYNSKNKKSSSTTKKTPAKKSIVKVELKPKIMKKSASKKTKIVYTKNKQRGTSNKTIDKQKKALPPEKRISKTGNAYYEYRKNESDIKNTLLGINKTPGIFGSNMYSHRDNIEKILREKISLLDTHKKLLKSSVGSNLKLHHRQLITTLKNQIASLKKQLREQNKLINSNLR